jgi:transposase InsO family protein
MRTAMVLDALKVARWSRGTTLEGLVCHSDACSPFTLLRHGERIAEIGAVPSIGFVGDSFDNALAETVYSHHKTELTRQQGPWRSIDTLNSQREPGFVGSKPSGYTARSTTSPRPSTKPPTIFTERKPTSWLESNDPSL